jgi:hypothetical protein
MEANLLPWRRKEKIPSVRVSPYLDPASNGVLCKNPGMLNENY